MRTLRYLCALAAAAAAVSARAGEEIECGRVAEWSGPRPFDARSGADPLNYPRDPLVDYRHLRLTLRIDDIAAKTVVGRADYTVRAIGPGVRSFSLDAMDFLDVQATSGGAPVEFSYDSRRIALWFAADLPTDDDTEISISYRVVAPDSGMVFVPPDDAYVHRPVSLHTQGQTETNRYWFPCHDSPNVRFTTEMIVTVPKPLTAVSNGKLLERRDEADGRTWTFHWKQEVPHVAYLTSLAVADFDVQRDFHNEIPVEYYVPKFWSAHTRRTFDRTPQMIALFEQRTGVRYPYAKYAQVVVPNFESGGMENISASTLTETCLLDERAAYDEDADGLIAHELAHQWYGDLLTCRTWAHIWLNEGFASFMDDVWFEHWKGRDWYETGFRRTFRRVAEADDPKQPDPLVYRNYSHEWEPFGHKGAMAYSKGSAILAMLRHMFGEEVFWKGLQTYTQRFAAQCVETEDFRRAMEEASGRSLERFFEQYCYRPGTPKIHVSYRWDAEHRAAIVRFKQTQHIDERTPAFVVPVELYFAWEGGSESIRYELTDREGTFRRVFETEPTMLCVDPHAGLLARLDVDVPRAMWLRILEKGPTACARMDAAMALGEDARPEVVPALAACLANDSEFWRVRAEAADALGRARTLAARDGLLQLVLQASVEEPRVRKAVVEALGHYRYDREAAMALVRFGKGEQSYGVVAAATRALGRIRAKEFDYVVVTNLGMPSRNDVFLLSAIDALADFEDMRGLDAAQNAASYGGAFRTRPHAIRVVGRLGRVAPPERRPAVREFLVKLLDDPQPNAVRAAISALGELGDVEAIPALEARAREGHGVGRLTRERLKDEAREAIQRIRSRAEEPAAVRSLREEVEQLRKDVDELRNKGSDKSAGVEGKTE